MLQSWNVDRAAVGRVGVDERRAELRAVHARGGGRRVERRRAGRRRVHDEAARRGLRRRSTRSRSPSPASSTSRRRGRQASSFRSRRSRASPSSTAPAERWCRRRRSRAGTTAFRCSRRTRSTSPRAAARCCSSASRRPARRPPAASGTGARGRMRDGRVRAVVREHRRDSAALGHSGRLVAEVLHVEMLVRLERERAHAHRVGDRLRRRADPPMNCSSFRHVLAARRSGEQLGSISRVEPVIALPGRRDLPHADGHVTPSRAPDCPDR